jgi:hypothetical protein
LRLLITGAGRSGTRWAAAAVTAAGVPCGHEQAFTPERQTEGWVAESSWLAAPHTPMPGTYVVHLVRHPLAVIASLTARGFVRPNRYGNYAARHIPGLAAITDPVERCATYWVAWNQLVVSDETMRVEDVTPADVHRWAAMVNPAAGAPALPAPTHQSKQQPPRVTWEQVAEVDGLVDLAQEVGYPR